MSDFLGWPVIPMPDWPAARSIDWSVSDTVAVATSPFTNQQQIQNWGGSLLEASITLPPMGDAAAREWMAWLMQLQGLTGVFAFGDPLGLAPAGTGAASVVVSGGDQTGYALNVAGGTGSGVLLPGDWIQIGLRLYRNLGTYNGGSAALKIWPSIRESPLDGAAVVTANAQGMFRLKSNQRKWSVDQNRLYGFTFEIREAI